MKFSKNKTFLIYVFAISLAIPVGAKCVWPQQTEAPKQRKIQLLELCDLVNAVRYKEGVSPLKLHRSIMRASQSHAKDMALRNYFSHSSPEGETFVDRLIKNGVNYRFAAENIAQGQNTAQEVLEGWLNSPGHRANLLNPLYNRLGLGLNDKHWVQNFAD